MFGGVLGETVSPILVISPKIVMAFSYTFTLLPDRLIFNTAVTCCAFDDTDNYFGLNFNKELPDI